MTTRNLSTGFFAATFLAVVMLFMSSCVSMSPKRTIYELAVTYESLHHDYTRAYNNATPEVQAMMEKEIHPKMRLAWNLIDQGLSVARSGDAPRRDRLEQLEALLIEIAMVIVDVAYSKEDYQ